MRYDMSLCIVSVPGYYTRSTAQPSTTAVPSTTGQTHRHTHSNSDIVTSNGPNRSNIINITLIITVITVVILTSDSVLPLIA